MTFIPTILSALLRALVMLAFAALVFSVTADALELTRNGKSYEIDVKLPDGAKFTSRGVDRVMSYRGIDVSLRLIQDEYADCGQLVFERESKMFDRGQYVSDESTVISPKECTLALFGPRGAVYSNYVMLEICNCYAAIHYTYPDGTDYAAGGELVSAINEAFSNRRKIAQGASVAETVEPDWKAAFDIFRKRDMSAQLAYNIYSQTAAFELASEREREAAVTYLSSLFGVSEYDVKNDFSGGVDWIYDVETGAELYGMSPQGIARSVSSCYLRGDPGRNCKLNYHQELGCRLTPDWVKLCSTPNSEKVSGVYDLCWGEPRGDMPMLPVVTDNAERSVELPVAGKGGQVKTAKLSKKPEKKAVPYCDDNIWRSYYSEIGFENAPVELRP